MRTPSLAIKLLTLWLSLGIGDVSAKVMELKVAALKTGAASLRDVRVRLDWPEGAGGGTLRVQAAALDFPTLDYRATRLDWQCPLVRVGGQGWRCAGTVRTAGSSAYPLALDLSPAATRAELRVRGSRLAYRSEAAAPDLSRIELERVPVAWLKGFLASLWAEGRWTQGTLAGRVDVQAPAKGPFEVRSDLAVSDLGLETPDGMIAAAGLGGRLRVDYREGGGATSVDTRLTLRGGEMLAQGLYAVLPPTPVEARVLMSRTGAKAPWRLPRIEWNDPGALVAQGSGALDGSGAISDLDLQLALPDLSRDRDRYLSGFLAPAGFADLLLTGQLDARLRLRGGAMHAIDARIADVNAVDSKARFTFAGIGGDMHWTREETAIASRLSWRSGAVYGIGLGPASYGFSSARGEFRLVEPVAVDVLAGQLRLDHFRWQPPAGAGGARYELGMTMDRLDLGSLSQRLGWPAFTGSIGGRIPSARYQDNVLTLDGGLRMDLFGGNVQIDGLVMERPFGVAPTLSADVAIQDIDLEPMTRVFGFGSITGRLDGHINQLRLVDWAPAAFDARLQTDSRWKGKRRISQRAVKDISSVGGSGLIAGLQAQVLQIFDDFGYDRIGLGCKLKDNICQMDGIGSAGDGYIIVAGAGLPRIQVVGFRRRVDWPTLVARLKAATEGQAPVIQ